MIAYSKKALLELEVLEEAAKWEEKKIISSEQFNRIKESYNPGLFIPNVFVRIGLFVLTIILVNAALGLFSIFNIFFDSSETIIGAFLLFFGLVNLAGLEGMISIKKTYRAGIDDGLLYLTTIYIITGLCLLFNDLIERSSHEELFYALIAFPFLVAASIRYLDNVITAVSYACLIFMVFDLLMIMGKTMSALLPFVVMIISFLLYFQSKIYFNSEKHHHWKWNLKGVQFLSLLVFYLAANYFVVRELSVDLLDLNLKKGEDIPFSIIFHITTIIIPAAYTYYGGKLKDRILFVSGLITSIFSVLTLKYYYSFAPIGFSLAIGGIMLAGIVWWAIKYFSPQKFDITSEKENEYLSTDAEALIISYSFPQKPNDTGSSTKFGGGNFGGGGAGGEF